MRDHEHSNVIDDAGDPWDALPRRSPLYDLMPKGMDGDQRESLISYLVRLARAHRLNPRHLLKHVFAVEQPSIGTYCYNSFFVHYARTANGLGRYALELSKVACRLTSRADLSTLTLLPLAALIPEKSEGLLAMHPRWCSECFSAQIADGGESYTPLIWALDLYRTCAKHGSPMQDRCTGCGNRQPFVPRVPDAARCDHCGASLAQPSADVLHPKAERPNARSNFGVELSLLAVIRRHGTLPDHSLANFRRSLRSLIDERHDGNKAEFCRAMGWNDWGVNGWLEKEQKISFPKLLELSQHFNVNPLDFCEPGATFPRAGVSPLPDQAPNPRTISTRGKRPKLTPAQRALMRGVLGVELNTAAAPASLRAIGMTHGLRRSALKYWFPDFCKQLSLKRAKLRNNAATRAMEERVLVVDRIVQSLIQNDLAPTRRQVDLELRELGLALARPLVFTAYLQARKKYCS